MKNKMLKMLVGMQSHFCHGYPGTDRSGSGGPFKDVSRTARIMRLSMKCGTSNIISGYENGEFRPTEVITRKHAAALVNRATKLQQQSRLFHLRTYLRRMPSSMT